jgi:hypothetical protein
MSNKEDIKAVKSVLHTGFKVTDDTDWNPDQLELDVWEISDELSSLLISKHHDYGPKNISQAPGGPINGLRVRMWDKMARINNLLDSNRHDAPAHESLEDSFRDLANYAIISILVLKGKWPTE